MNVRELLKHWPKPDLSRRRRRARRRALRDLRWLLKHAAGGDMRLGQIVTVASHETNPFFIRDEDLAEGLAAYRRSAEL